MLTLPRLILDRMNPFAPCVDGVTAWAKADRLLVGASLTPGKWVVRAAWRVMGVGQRQPFAQGQQVLNRAVGSPLEWAGGLLNPVGLPAPTGPARHWLDARVMIWVRWTAGAAGQRVRLGRGVPHRQSPCTQLAAPGD
jgi:hypothetical protein